MKALALFIWFIFIFFIPFFGKAQILEDEAYDLNTEIVLTGKVREIIFPEKGMVFLEVERTGKVYKVFLCPKWYYKQINPDFKVGDPVEIKGAKVFTKRHGPIFIARSIKNLRNNTEILLRGRGCEPCWRGGRMKRDSLNFQF